MAQPQRTGSRILLVDDFDDARDMYAEFLSSSGHQVVAVGDGQAALETPGREPLRLIILHIALPHVPGIPGIKMPRSPQATKPAATLTLPPSVEDGVRPGA